MRRWRLAGLELAVPVVILLAWWLWTDAGKPYYVSSPADIGAVLAREASNGGLLQNLWPSLVQLFLGFVGGSIIGVALGTFLGLRRRAATALSPILEYLRALPPVALIPLAFVAIGPGQTMAIVIVLFGVIWPVLLSTVDGVRSVDTTLEEMTRVFGIRPYDRLRYVVIPAASPAIISGLRNGLALAVSLMVVSEMAGSVGGLGYFTLYAQRIFAFPDMWAGMLILAALGYLVNLLFVLLERRVLFWQASVRTSK